MRKNAKKLDNYLILIFLIILFYYIIIERFENFNLCSKVCPWFFPQKLRQQAVLFVKVAIFLNRGKDCKGWRSQFRSAAKEWRRFDAGTLKSLFFAKQKATHKKNKNLKPNICFVILSHSQGKLSCKVRIRYKEMNL